VPSYNPPAAEPSYSPPADEAQDLYGVPLSPVYQSTDDASFDEEPAEQSYNDKRNTGFFLGKPDVFNQDVGVPDIWDMFSAEWGQRLQKRRGMFFQD